MPYVAINPLLYNAALTGFLAGMFSGQFPTDTTSTDYNNATQQAVAFAQAIDTAIGADTDITAGGVAIAPTTGIIQEKEIGRLQMLFGLSFAVACQHYSGPMGGPFTPQDFTTSGKPGTALVAGIKALYIEGKTGMLTP